MERSTPVSLASVIRPVRLRQVDDLDAVLTRRAKAISALSLCAQQLATDERRLAHLCERTVASSEEATSNVAGAARSFSAAYETALAGFDERWQACDAVATSWEPVRPASFLDGLPDESRSAVLEFLDLLVSDLPSLASRIAALEGPALSTLTASSPSPLQILLRLVLSLHGAAALRDFGVAVIGAAIEEMVPLVRDAAGPSAAAPMPSGLAAHRERELESFVLDVMDAVLTLGVVVEAPAVSEMKDGGAGCSPFDLGRSVEVVLLQLVHDARLARATVNHGAALMGQPGIPAQRAASVASTSASAWDTVGSLATGLLNLPVTGTSMILSGLGNAAPSTPPGELPPPSTLPPPELPFSSIGRLITVAATRLLDALAGCDVAAPLHLPHALIATLLTTHFPSNTRPQAHAKALVLLVVRFWAFEWLRKRISRAGAAGCRGPAPAGGGAGVSFDASDASAESPAALLEDVWLDPRNEVVSLLYGVHARLYAAVTDATGAGDKLVRDLLTTARTPAELDEVKALRRSAKTLVAAFGGRRAWTAGEFVAKPRASAAAAPTGGVRSALVSASDLWQLWDAFGPTLFSAPSGLGVATSPPTTPSFKRRVSQTTSSGSSPAEETSPIAQPHGLSQRVALALSRLRNARSMRNDDPLADLAHVFVDGAGKVTASLPSNIETSTATVAESPVSAVSSIGAALWKTKPAGVPSSDCLTEAELATLRQAVAALGQQGATASALGTTLEVAIRRARSADAFVLARLFEQAHDIVGKHAKLPTADLLAAIARPWQAAQTHAAARTREIEGRLVQLGVERERLIRLARGTRAAIDKMRVRAWYAELRCSDAFRTLREQLGALVSPDRLDVDVARGVAAARRWREQNGVADVLVAGDDESFTEATMFVHAAVRREMDPARIAASASFAREAAMLHLLVPTTDAQPSSLFGSAVGQAGSLFHAGSSLLRVSTSEVPAPASTVATALLSFGASTPALALADEESLEPVASISSYLLALRMQLLGLAVSDMQSAGLVSLRRPDGQCYGADSWIRMGAVGASGDEAVRRLLQRFAHHPSPSVQLTVLRDLEGLLASRLSSPDAQITRAAPRDELQTDQVRRLSMAIRRQMSEAERTRVGPGRRSGSRTASGDETGEAMPLAILAEPATTDALVVALEGVLTSTDLPADLPLFAELQLIISLVPPEILYLRPEGKALFDLVLAAVAVKAERVQAAVQGAVDKLSDGLSTTRQRSQRVILLGAREGNPIALDLLDSLGLSL